MPDFDFRKMLERVRAQARPELSLDALLTLAPSAPTCRSEKSQVFPYARKVLFQESTGEVMLATWAPDAACAVHDHGGAGGAVIVLAGQIEETPYTWGDMRDGQRGLVAGAPRLHRTGAQVLVPRSGAHAMRAVGDAVTLHLYAPAPGALRVHDLENRQSLVLAEGHGAWLPEHTTDALKVEAWSDVAARRARKVIAVFYTTHYRSGRADFARAADTLQRALQVKHPAAEVCLHPARFKREFTGALEAYADDARALMELHFIGHSGMYGIMFGSNTWPEQLSPHEWRSLRIPFASDGHAVFHACRTGRWFASFFARTFGVRASGHHGYTTVSRSPSRYLFDHPLRGAKREVHVISCVGRKSHGTMGMIRKHLGSAKAQALQTFEPTPADEAPSYDSVAPLYDEAFEDIRVRGPEFAFVTRALQEMGSAPLRVLDVGCGNGALLAALGSRVSEGVGVDVSAGMLAQARERDRKSVV